MNEELNKTIDNIFDKGDRSLKAAREHIEKKDFDFASSKAYYAVFHYLQAILLIKGLTFSKHSAVIAEFNKNFIKPAIFPKNFSKDIERLFKHRQLGDYDYSIIIDKQLAEEDVEAAKIICTEIKKYLRPQAF